MAAALAIVVAGLSLSGTRFIGRSIELISDSQSVRLGLFQIARDAIETFPWTGWGLGSFAPIYSIFQPVSLSLNFDKTHNTYLESAMELGIPFSFVLILSILAPALRCVRGLAERRQNTQYSAAAVGATFLIGIQSTIDFGVQIPAVAVAFSAVLGIGWAQSWSSRTAEDIS
jgi:O-antigen ligase